MNELARIETPGQIQRRGVDFTFADIGNMGTVLCKAGMFKNAEQAVVLLLLAQAYGLHPIQALEQYYVVNGQPMLKSQAALARFQRDGGKIEWIESSPTLARARFHHPNLLSPLELEWTWERAKGIGLTSKENWRFYPEEMLRWRVTSAGIRIVAPHVLQGLPVEYEDESLEPLNYATSEMKITEEVKPRHTFTAKQQAQIDADKAEIARREAEAEMPPDRGAEVPPVDNVVQAASALDKRVAAAIESQGPQVYQVVNGVTFDYTVPKGRANAGEPAIGIEYTLIDSQEYQHTARYWEFSKAQERSGMASPQLWRGEIRCKLVQRGKNPYQDMSALEYVTTATQQPLDADGAELPPLSTGV